MVSVLRRPSAALAPFVETLWYVDEPLPDALERTVPTGAMQLTVNLAEDQLRWYDGEALERLRTTSGAGLAGAVSRAFGIDTAEQRWSVGAVFRPGGAARFFHPPADELTTPVIGLDALWGRPGEVLRERLLHAPTPAATLITLERSLLEQMIDSRRPDPALEAALAALERGWSVRRTVDHAGTTPATLGRKFARLVGLSPKPYARVRRLQRVLATVTRADQPSAPELHGSTAGLANAADGPDPADVPRWSDLAVEHGYFDQAHLISEFRALTGDTPTAYRPRSPLERNHLQIELG